MSRVTPPQIRLTRRTMLRSAGAFGGTLLAGGADGLLGSHRAKAQSSAVPAVVTSDNQRPQIPYGVMSGDPAGGRVILWSKTDRPARMLVEFATREDFRDARRVTGPAALPTTDYTARIDLGGLPAGADIFYRVTFQDLCRPEDVEHCRAGRLRMPGGARRTITFAYSGDEAGQGWGINPEWGGYRLYETMRGMRRISSSIPATRSTPTARSRPRCKTDDGKVWQNLVTPGKAKVAETLDEFRANFAYNLLDENKRRFAAEVPFLVQWDDHETRNNWYPGQTIGIDAYKVKSASLLAAYARGRRCSNTTRCASAARTPSGSIADSRTVRCSTSSCSTSAAIAAPTRRTGRPGATPTPRSSAARSWPG